MPLPASYPLKAIREIFAEHGIYAIEEYPDGVIMWGNEPISSPYTGEFQIADLFSANRYDIFTIRSILSKLDKAGSQAAIEDALAEHIHDGYDDDEEND